MGFLYFDTGHQGILMNVSHLLLFMKEVQGPQLSKRTAVHAMLVFCQRSAHFDMV